MESGKAPHMMLNLPKVASSIDSSRLSSWSRLLAAGALTLLPRHETALSHACATMLFSVLSSRVHERNGAILRDNCPWGGYTAGIPRSGICGDREDLRLVLPRTKRGVR